MYARYQDFKEHPDDAHVLYYLGVTNFAALEAMLGRGEHQITPELTKVERVIGEGDRSLLRFRFGD
jgi:hypothetical protein